MDDHLSDEALSMLVDQPAAAPAHLASCPTCSQRLEELRAVVELLHGLPEVDPPRDFSIGPRVLDPPNVTRSRRVYAWTRAAGASLAAVFVLLVGGAFYLDATAPNTTGVLSQAAPAPVAAPSAPPTTPPSPAAVAAARPAAPAAQSGPAGGEAPGSGDLSIATTSARPLPTLTPTSPPPAVAAIQRAAPVGDPGAPLRQAAAVVGVLAMLTLLGCVALRHQLRSRREG